MSAVINKHIFGSQINPRIKKKLQSRQVVAGEDSSDNSNINDSVTGVQDDYLQNNFTGKILDLSSRTPFVRMWAGVQVREILDDESNRTYFTREQVSNMTEPEWENASLSDKTIALHDALHQGDNRNLHINPSSALWDEVKKEFYVYKKEPELVETGMKKVYILNNGISKPYSETSEAKYNYTNENGDPLTDDDAEFFADDVSSERFKRNQDEVFPDQHNVINDQNKFLRPESGIISVTSETMKSTYNSVKQTTVSFVVHNMADFDAIYSRHFLRPGAQLFVDYGWNTAGSSEDITFYDPNEYVNNPNTSIHELIYGDRGWVSRHNGDCDTLHGHVSSYNSNILPNGSIECSVTIISPNTTLYNHPLTENKRALIRLKLEHFLQFRGFYINGNVKERENLASAIANYNSSTTYQNISDLTKYMTQKAIESDQNYDLTPTKANSEAGVYTIPQAVENHNYIQWGLIEDEILNKSFAFTGLAKKVYSMMSGNIPPVIQEEYEHYRYNLDEMSEEDFEGKFAYNRQLHIKLAYMRSRPTDLAAGESLIKDNFYDQLLGGLGLDELADAGVIIEKNVNDIEFSTGFDSSNAFTIFSKDLFDRQEAIAMNATPGDKPPLFLYPSQWDSSHSVLYGNVPIRANVPEGMSITEYDKSKNQIPIREIFIQTKLLLNTLCKPSGGTQLLSEQLKLLFSALNTKDLGSAGIWDWAINSATIDDSTLCVNDRSYMSAFSDDKQPKSVFDELFVFDVFSKNSIVSGYNLNMSISSDKIYQQVTADALAANSSQITPNTANLYAATSLQSLLTKVGKNAIISDLPLNTTPAIERDLTYETLKNITGDLYKDFIESYEHNPQLKDIRPHSADYDNVNLLNFDSQIFPNITENKGNSTEESNSGAASGITNANTAFKNDRNLISKGFAIATTQNQLHVYKAQNQWFTNLSTGKHRSIIFPFTLTISIYGMTGIQAGDLFRVSYLPEVYLENVMFRVVQIKNDLTVSGWTTTLEATMVNRPDTQKYLQKPYLDIRMSGEMASDIITSNIVGEDDTTGTAIDNTIEPIVEFNGSSVVSTIPVLANSDVTVEQLDIVGQVYAQVNASEAAGIDFNFLQQGGTLPGTNITPEEFFDASNALEANMLYGSSNTLGPQGTVSNLFSVPNSQYNPKVAELEKNTETKPTSRFIVNPNDEITKLKKIMTNVKDVFLSSKIKVGQNKGLVSDEPFLFLNRTAKRFQVTTDFTGESEGVKTKKDKNNTTIIHPSDTPHFPSYYSAYRVKNPEGSEFGFEEFRIYSGFGLVYSSLQAPSIYATENFDENFMKPDRNLKVTMEDNSDLIHSVGDTKTIQQKSAPVNPFMQGLDPMWVMDNETFFNQAGQYSPTENLTNSVYCPLEPGKFYYLIFNRVISKNSTDFFCIIPEDIEKRGNQDLSDIYSKLDYNIYTQTRAFSNDKLAFFANSSRIGKTEENPLENEGVTNNIKVKDLEPDGSFKGEDSSDILANSLLNNVGSPIDIQTGGRLRDGKGIYYQVIDGEEVDVTGLPYLKKVLTSEEKLALIKKDSQLFIHSSEVQAKLRRMHGGSQYDYTYPYLGMPAIGKNRMGPIKIGTDSDADGYADSWEYSTIAMTDEQIINEILDLNGIPPKTNQNLHKIGRHPSAVESAPQLNKFGEFTSIDFKIYSTPASFGANTQLFRFAHEWVSVGITDSVNNNKTCTQICESQEKRCINQGDNFWLPITQGSPKRDVQMNGKDFTIYEEPVLSCEPIFSAWPPNIVDNIDFSEYQQPGTEARQEIDDLFRHGGFLYGHQSQNHYEYNSCDHEFGQVGPVDEGNFDSLLCCCAPLEYSDEWWSSVEEQDLGDPAFDGGSYTPPPTNEECVDCTTVCGQCGAGLGSGPCLEGDCDSIYCDFGAALFESANTCTPKSPSISNCCP